ncbi:MAG TPA: IS110 family transposase [Methylomirabilota bacterium]|nr:IS110 family transposase [Methylomirabilota bacterium]
MMKLTADQLNAATFVGIDAHPDSHTALAMNRFKEPKGHVSFPNTFTGISQFQTWLQTLGTQKDQIVIGVEGGGNARNTLLSTILSTHDLLFEVNPLYTKHKRSFGTKGDKTDLDDAKLIAGVLTTELEELPRITPEQLTSAMLCLKKAVWFYEEITVQGARLKNQLHKLNREHKLTQEKEEKQLLLKIIKARMKELSFVEKTKVDMEKELKVLFRGYGKNLTSIRGVGIITAARIIAHTGGIERFSNRDGYVRYTGIAPLARSSGKTNFFVKANRGNRKLNSVYYFASLCRIVHNPQVKELYEKKIASGKTKREAITFIMRKTAILAYSMLKSGKEYRQ